MDLTTGLLAIKTESMLLYQNDRSCLMLNAFISKHCNQANGRPSFNSLCAILHVCIQHVQRRLRCSVCLTDVPQNTANQ